MKRNLAGIVLAAPGTRFVRCGAAVLLSTILAGCPSGSNTSQGPVQGKVVIKGSNTLGEALTPKLVAEYTKQQPAVTFALESKGTATGFAALMDGSTDIAAASRVVSSDELNLAHTKGVDLYMYTVGSYSFAVIVNKASPVSNLSRDQVRDIYTGVTTNWKAVGGADSPIHLYARDAVSGTHLGFRELAMEDKPYAASIKTFTNYAAIAEAVGKDPAGIGYASIDLENKGDVKAISIRGVMPSVLSVNEGQYPFARILRLYTNKTKETAAARSFIEFAQSADGQKIVADLGYIPRP